MPLSGVDGSKFNMKINLFVVSLDEHNVPRVERIQTTKDTKVLNTICLYYRIFFFSLQELCCPFNFVKKKIVNYVYPLLRPGVCFSPLIFFPPVRSEPTFGENLPENEHSRVRAVRVEKILSIKSTLLFHMVLPYE